MMCGLTAKLKLGRAKCGAEADEMLLMIDEMKSELFVGRILFH
jgi:hypothetical protein